MKQEKEFLSDEASELLLELKNVSDDKVLLTLTDFLIIRNMIKAMITYSSDSMIKKLKESNDILSHLMAQAIWSSQISLCVIMFLIAACCVGICKFF